MKEISESAQIQSPCKIYNNVVIEDNCQIGKYTYIRPFSKIYKNVSIGSFCAIAENVHIGVSAHPTDWLSTHTFQYDNLTKFPNSKLYEAIMPQKYISSTKINIGSDVWIGQNVIISHNSKPNSTINIGNGVIIGANSVITKSIPDYAIVIGYNQIIRYRFDKDRIKDLLELKWWELDDSELAKVKSFDSISNAIEELKLIRGIK
ncbi:CatB-related O-acetyltransferase [Sulfurovum sp.]|uniref:CatB-related O-acetyltransferase n=1 Tax=Sulfurovum sp. TaxID=1969726 RepID=UPI002A35EADA|nr:CatB-related O-acetyltransferase [Sulfurovum sp.]MDY0403613.1 CatB-related O-acetyltransferase [Sulfurovum sp.]